ncbi:carbamoyltransferase HypF [Nonomuraea guangzhouensis]|uniref:Carbamoyltransferase n=1 Tax=Nonomuraea guangzhouensis TaxID=1291555 RepID=A0ABW4GXP0_9ACTN|nr:carbamoyltransferase HypF [Nonomuraea guangzhouensis]
MTAQLSSTATTLRRWRIRVNGVVQGVGYRPFVYNLARSEGLSGWALNDPRGVLVEAEGEEQALARFATALREQAPVLARVVQVSVEHLTPTGEQDGGFEIRHSNGEGRAATIVPADAHVCDECLRELFDPADRRHRYPFINCTNCGPRYSLIRSLPYDRERTTMAAFAMCADCRGEYEDPADRRYHAQPIACPACGPALTLSGPDGEAGSGEEALRLAAMALAAGRIVAIKSVGGFHLAADARDADAVRRLRARKKRDAKPFAIMVRDLAAVAGIAEVTADEAELMTSPARPIVLVRKLPGALPEELAPSNPNLGVMLPSAPLHWLVLDESGLDVMVMTSGNVSGLPIAYRDRDALDQLFEVADLILHHDREIETRVDDSVVRCSTHPDLDRSVITFIRRSRGYAPYPVHLSAPAAAIMAYGAELKTTVAVADGARVYLSQHIGDLKNEQTFASHGRTAEHLARLHQVTPAYAACDLHPGFRSTRRALELFGSRALRVQHHHAHMAACMAENGLDGPTLGVIFDGAGYGPDGTIWGGEFLLGDYAAVQRVAHLRRLPLLGGDKAVLEPIRTGFALAMAAFGRPEAAVEAFPVLRQLDERQRHVFATMAERGLNSPPTSSMGRLFDGVAALAGVCSRAEFEAQGPIGLEGLLGRDLTVGSPYPFERTEHEGVGELDFRPAVRGLADDLAAGAALADLSRRFHSGVVAAVVEECTVIRQAYGVDQVVLSGGVFLNEFMLINCLVALRRAGFRAWCHRLVPTNDGGIALGQVMVANARLTREVAE